MIGIIDLGSQYTQLIAKKLRHLGFAIEVMPASMTASDLKRRADIKGVIFSGSPASVGEIELDSEILDVGVPVLGLCYGYQWIAEVFGGKNVKQSHRQYGSALFHVSEPKHPLFVGVSKQVRVWMSHGDSVSSLPPSLKVLGTSANLPAAFEVSGRPIFALQYHPEVDHSEQGELLLKNFATLCGDQQSYDLSEELTKLRLDLKKTIGTDSEVVCAVSGGVDSTVVACLLAEFTDVHAYFVDHGFLRSYDQEDLFKILSGRPRIRLHVIDARDQFFRELEGVSDPEIKRRTIGRLFIEAFASKASKEHPHASLAQGTIFSDVIESAGGGGHSQSIKSHHNVGGLPKDLPFKGLIEPLKRFFKDEVRSVGRILGIPTDFLMRHPFPGPGLAIRVVGPIDRSRVELLRKADAVLYRELKSRRLYEKIWQSAAILLPVRSVGVMGDGRSFESACVLRLVSSSDAMTAEATDLPLCELKDIASLMINEVPGINRILFDLTSKPPGTIEWE